MARRKRITQKPGSKASPIVNSAGKDNLERVEVEDEVNGEPLEEIFADTVDVFQEVGEEHPLASGVQAKSGINVESRSWVMEAEEQDLQELAKDKWSKFQDNFAARGGVRLNYEEPMLRDGC